MSNSSDVIQSGSVMLWDADDHGGRAVVEVIQPTKKIGPVQWYKVRIVKEVVSSQIRKVIPGTTREIGHPAFDGSPRLFPNTEFADAERH